MVKFKTQNRQCRSDVWFDHGLIMIVDLICNWIVTLDLGAFNKILINLR